MNKEINCPLIIAAIKGEIEINGNVYPITVKVGNNGFCIDDALCALEELQKN